MSPAPPRGAALGDLASILRLHIVLIAVAAALVMSFVLTGRYQPDVALLGGLDWLLINLLNRLTDLAEDRANAIRGTERVAARRGAFAAAWGGLLVGSFALGHALHPELTAWRALVQLIGLGYSVPLVPAWRRPAPGAPRAWGLARFKDLYFLKNFMSAALFVLTVFAFPLLAAGAPPVHPGGWAAAAVLVAFFVPFELTYEILYDLRDLEGDRAAGVPTYPVVHGPRRARQIIDGLLALSAAVLAAGLAAGALGLREGLFLAAPAVQLAAYRPRYRRGLTSADCIGLTHLGTALLLLFLAGTAAWRAAGLPEHVLLR